MLQIFLVIIVLKIFINTDTLLNINDNSLKSESILILFIYFNNLLNVY